MKKIIITILVALCFTGVFLALTSCALHAHTYDESALQNNQSYHWYVCNVVGCGEAVGKTPHTFTEKIRVDATCVAEGKTVQACVCGYEKTTVIEKIDHDFREATCEKPMTCKFCPVTEGDARDHIWTNATCTEPKTCIYCSRTEGEMLGHDIIEKIAEPTCFDEGVLTKLCSRCGNIESEESINALGHAMVESDEPSPDGNDLIVMKCSRCDYATTREKVSAVVMVLDLSNSMKDLMGGKSRFDIALEGVKNVIMLDSFLKDTDYLGLVLFDADSYVAIELQPLGNSEKRQEICLVAEYEMRHYFYSFYLDSYGEETEIPVSMDDGTKYTSQGYTRPAAYDRGGNDRITGQYIKSYGTSYKCAIDSACEMITKASQILPFDCKQMLFISDGQPNDKDSGYIETVERMATEGTITSALEIGGDGGEAELSKITEAGKGRMKKALNAKDLVSFMVDLITFGISQ